MRGAAKGKDEVIAEARRARERRERERRVEKAAGLVGRVTKGRLEKWRKVRSEVVDLESKVRDIGRLESRLKAAGVPFRLPPKSLVPLLRSLLFVGSRGVEECGELIYRVLGLCEEQWSDIVEGISKDVLRRRLKLWLFGGIEKLQGFSRSQSHRVVLEVNGESVGRAEVWFRVVEQVWKVCCIEWDGKELLELGLQCAESIPLPGDEGLLSRSCVGCMEKIVLPLLRPSSSPLDFDTETWVRVVALVGCGVGGLGRGGGEVGSVLRHSGVVLEIAIKLLQDVLIRKHKSTLSTLFASPSTAVTPDHPPPIPYPQTPPFPIPKLRRSCHPWPLHVLFTAGWLSLVVEESGGGEEGMVLEGLVGREGGRVKKELGSIVELPLKEEGGGEKVVERGEVGRREVARDGDGGRGDGGWDGRGDGEGWMARLVGAFGSAVATSTSAVMESVSYDAVASPSPLPPLPSWARGEMGRREWRKWIVKSGDEEGKGVVEEKSTLGVTVWLQVLAFGLDALPLSFWRSEVPSIWIRDGTVKTTVSLPSVACNRFRSLFNPKWLRIITPHVLQQSKPHFASDRLRNNDETNPTTPSLTTTSTPTSATSSSSSTTSTTTTSSWASRLMKSLSSFTGGGGGGEGVGGRRDGGGDGSGGGGRAGGGGKVKERKGKGEVGEMKRVVRDGGRAMDGEAVEWYCAVLGLVVCRNRLQDIGRGYLMDGTPLLNVLSFAPEAETVRRLGHWIVEGVDQTKFCTTMAYPGLCQCRGPFAVTAIWAAAAQRLFLVLDDSELHSPSHPIPLARPELEQVTRTLVLSYAHAHGSGYASPRGLALPPTSFWPAWRDNVASVLRAIYDRHSRVSLTADSTFHPPKPIPPTLLSSTPFVFPFVERVRIFDAERNALHRQRAASGPPVQITVRREGLLDSALAAVERLDAASLRRRFHVSFVDEFGMAEAGIDAGGLFKDLWTSISKPLFDPRYGLFAETPHHTLYPNPDAALALGAEDAPRLYRFAGRILGKALLEGITVQPIFAHFMLARLLGKRPSFNDLHTLDPALYRSLLQIKRYDGDVENDLCLTFVEPRGDGALDETPRPLIPGGADIPVTRHNRLQYIDAVADARMHKAIRSQTFALCQGLEEALPTQWLTIFSEPELQVLISGDETVDVDDLRRHTRYGGGYSGASAAIRSFWSVMEEMDTKNRAALLRFVTACERAPPLGFQQLQPPFTIQCVPGREARSRLPTASTCFNVLKLPDYPSKAVLKEKLLLAIHSGAGFDLS